MKKIDYSLECSLNRKIISNICGLNTLFLSNTLIFKETPWPSKLLRYIYEILLNGEHRFNLIDFNE